MEHHGVRADLTFDAGPVIFNALGSYRDLKYTQNTGSSNGDVYPGFDYADAATDLDGYGSAYWVTNSQSFVAELRAYSPDTSRLRWTVGAFMFDETQDAFLGQTSDPHAGYGGGEFNMPGVKGKLLRRLRRRHLRRDRGVPRARRRARHQGAQGPQERSVGALEQPADELRGEHRSAIGMTALAATARRASSTRASIARPTPVATPPRIRSTSSSTASTASAREIPCRWPSATTRPTPWVEEQQPRIQKDSNGNFRCTTGIRAEILNGTLPGWNDNIYQYVPQNNEVDNTFFDWRAGIEYDLSKDNLAYATVSTGHKAGGFNDTQDFGLVDLYNTDYKPESMTAFELGSKNTFLERKLRLNGSAFAYLYQDLVFQTIVSVGPDPFPDDPDRGAPASAVRQNAPATTRVLGLDLDFAYALPAGLEIEVHGLLMDSKFGDGTVVNDSRIGFGDNSLVDLGGNYLPRAPVFTLNYALSQLIFTDVGSFNWIIQGQTVGKQYLSVFNGDGTGVLPLVPSTPERPNDPSVGTTSRSSRTRRA